MIKNSVISLPYWVFLSINFDIFVKLKNMLETSKAEYFYTGSCLFGTLTENSDIDLFVEYSKETEKEILKISEIFGNDVRVVNDYPEDQTMMKVYTIYFTQPYHRIHIQMISHEHIDFKVRANYKLVELAKHLKNANRTVLLEYWQEMLKTQSEYIR